MDEEERSPGITFNLISTEHRTTVAGVQVKRVLLDCTLDDEELWGPVEKQFQEGLRVHRDETFHAAVMSAQSAEIADLRREVEELERKLRREQDAKLQVEEELGQYRRTLQQFDRAVRGGGGLIE
jgi:CII-binding regulator of phage lambda lysogenization HflD